MFNETWLGLNFFIYCSSHMRCVRGWAQRATQTVVRVSAQPAKWPKTNDPARPRLDHRVGDPTCTGWSCASLVSFGGHLSVQKQVDRTRWCSKRFRSHFGCARQDMGARTRSKRTDGVGEGDKQNKRSRCWRACSICTRSSLIHRLLHRSQRRRLALN
jgi:hypothetical protein